MRGVQRKGLCKCFCGVGGARWRGRVGSAVGRAPSACAVPLRGRAAPTVRAVAWVGLQCAARRLSRLPPSLPPLRCACAGCVTGRGCRAWRPCAVSGESRATSAAGAGGPGLGEARTRRRWLRCFLCSSGAPCPASARRPAWQSAGACSGMSPHARAAAAGMLKSSVVIYLSSQRGWRSFFPFAVSRSPRGCASATTPVPSTPGVPSVAVSSALFTAAIKTRSHRGLRAGSSMQSTSPVPGLLVGHGAHGHQQSKGQAGQKGKCFPTGQASALIL